MNLAAPSLANTLLELASIALLLAVAWGVWALLGLVSRSLGLTRLQLLGLGWLTGFFR
jgi:hypothetical protein